MISPDGPNQFKWESSPLCRRYLTAFVADLPVQVLEGAAATRAHVARWGVGFLEDSKCETLSAWVAPPSVQTLNRETLLRLKFRGVEKVRFFVCNEASIRAEACNAFPDAVVLPSFGRLLVQSQELVAPRDRRLVARGVEAMGGVSNLEAARDSLSELVASRLGVSYPVLVELWRDALKQLAPLYALPPRLQRVIRSEDGIVQEIQQSLTRAVARHGNFVDPQDAMSFLADALEREQRRLEARGMDRVGRLKTVVARPGMNLGTQPLAY